MEALTCVFDLIHGYAPEEQDGVCGGTIGIWAQNRVLVLWLVSMQARSTNLRWTVRVFFWHRCLSHSPTNSIMHHFIPAHALQSRLSTRERGILVWDPYQGLPA